MTSRRFKITAIVMLVVLSVVCATVILLASNKKLYKPTAPNSTFVYREIAAEK